MADKPTRRQKQREERRRELQHFRIAQEQYAFIEEAVPKAELYDRLSMYSKLRRNYFTPTQAANIVTATKITKGYLRPIDPKRPQRGGEWIKPATALQDLDLTHPEWEKRIAIHREAMKAQARDLMGREGYTPHQAMLITTKNVDTYYRQSDKGASFDVFEDYIKSKAMKPMYNTDKAFRERDAKLAKRISKDMAARKRAREQGRLW